MFDLQYLLLCSTFFMFLYKVFLIYEKVIFKSETLDWFKMTHVVKRWKVQ